MSLTLPLGRPDLFTYPSEALRVETLKRIVCMRIANVSVKTSATCNYLKINGLVL